MLTRLLTAVLLISIFGLLIWQRFDTPPRLEVMVEIIEGESEYKINETFRRGEVIDTNDEYLLILIENDISLALDKNTRIELEDLGREGPVVRLLRGRIYIKADETPVWITTNTSENTLYSGTATIINYDFLEKVQVIPMDGSILTTIKSINEYLLIPVPIEITEGNNPGYQNLEVDLTVGPSAEFYEWIEAQVKITNDR